MKMIANLQVKEEPIDGGWDKSLSVQRPRSAPLYGMQHFQVYFMLSHLKTQ
jgi:hypothetical protein